MENIAIQLRNEDWAYQHGYENEVQISLVADFLNGIYAFKRKIEMPFAVLPIDAHLSKPIREAFYRAGQELAGLKLTISESDVTTALSRLFSVLHDDIIQVLDSDSILASTGDCRGACAYNTGDRSEYRNYGW